MYNLQYVWQSFKLKIIKFSSTYEILGVGGLVIKDNKVLLVKERFAISGKWKLPGGHADSGEDLGEAAVREVFEETGIRAKELGLITFRHTHPHPQLNFPCKIFELSNNPVLS